MIARVNFFGRLAVLDGLLPLLAEGEAPAAVVVSSNSAGLTPAHDGLLDAPARRRRGARRAPWPRRRSTAPPSTA